MVTLNSRIVASSQQISTEMPDEMIVLSLKDGVYYGLDPVGAFVWHHIQSPQSVQVVVDALTAEYDVSTEEAGRDMLHLLDNLQQAGLVDVLD